MPESRAHRIESAARPDLGLLELLRELSGGLRLPDELGERERRYEGHLARVAEQQFPERERLESDSIDLWAIALALTRCRMITCDAFTADLVRRARFDLLRDAELYTGRRADVDRLRHRLERLQASGKDLPGARLPPS